MFSKLREKRRIRNLRKKFLSGIDASIAETDDEDQIDTLLILKRKVEQSGR